MKKNIDRFERQILLGGFGIDGQKLINEAKILCIGAGGLGCPVLLYLASSGFKKIGIVDYDVISYSNLPRQILYTEQDIGQNKVDIAKKILKSHNSAVDIITYNVRVAKDNIRKITKDYDMVIDCTDNFTTRLIIGDATFNSKIVLIRGAVLQYEGQIAIFNYKNSLCHRCLFDDLPKDDDTISTDKLGVLNTLCEMVGSIIVSEAIKIITGIGRVNNNYLILLDALEPSIKKIKITKRSNCRLCKENSVSS